MSSNVFAVAAHNMKNNNARMGCLQLVMRNIVPSSSHDDMTQTSMNMPIFSYGYDPLSLGIPCNNSVRYDPISTVRQHETTHLFSQSIQSSQTIDTSQSIQSIDTSHPINTSQSSQSSSSLSTFDDSAWDSDIDDAIEREKEKEKEMQYEDEFFDIETGLMDVNIASSRRPLHLASIPPSPFPILSPDQEQEIDMYASSAFPSDFMAYPIANLGVVC